jgi:sulfonate transport system substrate-binding protein
MKWNWKKIVLALLLIGWAGGTYYGYRQTVSPDDKLTTVTIGYQKGDPVDISRSRGVLAKKMKELGYKVVYKEFTDGASEMQALAAGSINYARTGDTPPVTAAAAGTDIAYIAAGAKRSNGSGILVQSDSDIKTLTDLKGKKVAYTQSTSSQYLLLMALEKAGLGTDDIEWVNMKQADAAIAFSKGSVDAWVTWDPYTAQGQVTQNARLLTNGVGLSNNRDFILSTTKYAKKHEQVNEYLVKYLAEDMTWANENPDELVTLLTKALGMKKAIVEKMVDRRDWTLTTMTKSIAAEEQDIANAFYANGLITKKITTADDVIYVSEP